jgi:hypothetical protein
MPPTSRRSIATVVFDERWFEADLRRTSDVGADIARIARRRYERKGVPTRQLRHCDAEGRDATSLPGCLKVYLPSPAGRFGMVLQLMIRPAGPHLRCLAFGTRHHPRGSRALTVYQIAYRRLQCQSSKE